MLQHLLVHVIHDGEHQDSGDPGPGRAPAEPVERAREQLRIDDPLRSAVDLGLKRSVDPVEEVEVSDPGDACDYVEPAKDRLECRRDVHSPSPPCVWPFSPGTCGWDLVYEPNITSADGTGPERRRE